MILVADSSALVALAACDSLALLDEIFGQVIVPDKRGRKIASINQIRTIGSLGVLLQAKRKGLVSHIAPLVQKITESPIFISEGLVATVLELAGELDRLP